MAKNLEISYLLDFYGEVLTQKQREVMEQYYNDDLSLSEIGENFGITRQGVRDAIKHGEATLLELEEKVGFAARYRKMQARLAEMEQVLRKAKFANSSSYGGLSVTEVNRVLTQLLEAVAAMSDADDLA
ncbi:MAG: YlxM family DNA-binding protein [Faecalibacterium sp.]|nr:YlxM family DNA-binding protein [Faecalibacterium sp.]